MVGDILIISYWKLDWGKQCTDFRKNISTGAKKKPNLKEIILDKGVKYLKANITGKQFSSKGERF